MLEKENQIFLRIQNFYFGNVVKSKQGYQFYSKNNYIFSEKT